MQLHQAPFGIADQNSVGYFGSAYIARICHNDEMLYFKD